MKRLLAFGALVLALAGCGGATEQTTVAAPPTTSSRADTCTKTLVQAVQSTADLFAQGGLTAVNRLNGRFVADPEWNSWVTPLIGQVLIFMEGPPRTRAEVDAFYGAVGRKIGTFCATKGVA